MKQQASINKKIFIEPSWRIHSFYKELITSPPQGYEYSIRHTYQENAYDKLARFNLSYLLQRKVINRLMPLNLVKAYIERFGKIPEGIDLTYAVNHLVFRKEPWIIDCEYAATIVGGDNKHLKRFKGTVEKALSSAYCKGILCWHEAAKETLLRNLDCKGFEEKIMTIPPAVAPKNFIKNFDDKKVKLLFVNSCNISGQFERKGGREVMESFAVLSKMYNNLEMVVRSDIPEDIKNKYADVHGLRIIDEIIPWQEMEQEFKTADIFMAPSHVTPYQAFLDAMSYELPIITIDAWANPEIVEDGKTGIVCRKSTQVEYYNKTGLPEWDTPKFLKGIRMGDNRVTNELVEKTGILIENTNLRREMGKAGRHEVEKGKFSIQNRNEKLKKIFDEATFKRCEV
jgi:glycosyltransferase involved in cell wall biosynthesis